MPKAPTKKARQYPVPKGVSDELGVEYVTTDQMELIAAVGVGTSSAWAAKVLAKENQKLVETIIGESTDLPFGLLASGGEDDDSGIIVSSLALRDDVWDAGGWKRKSNKDTCSACSKANEPKAWIEHHESSADSDSAPEGLEYPEFMQALDQSLQMTLSPDLEQSIQEGLGVDAEDEDDDDVSVAAGVCPDCGAHMATGRTAIELSLDDVAAVIRALQEGADGVVFKSYAPLAHLTAPLVSAMTPQDTGLPAGSLVVAVVDESDAAAVLELLGVAPGPVVMLRESGQWVASDEWRQSLTSASPPPIVTLEDPETIEAVISQVDAYDPEAQRAADEAAEAAAAEEESGEDGVVGSVYTVLDQICRENQEAELLAMIAASPVRKAANKAAGAERLRQYWMKGEGALKIRWGTKGDWRRCVRQLTKYLGPRSKGYCNLLHARVTGTWPNSKGAKKVPNPAVKAQAIAKQLSR